jgi:VWFA-related protein
VSLSLFKYGVFVCLILLAPAVLRAQDVTVEFPLGSGAWLEVINHHGRVQVSAIDATVASFTVSSSAEVTSGDIRVENAKGRTRVTAAPAQGSKRIDLTVTVPIRSKVKIITTDGEISVRGDLSEISAETQTGTVVTDLPAAELKYEMQWTAARPRFVADFDLESVREGSAGRFSIKGVHRAPVDDTPRRDPLVPETEGNGDRPKPATETSVSLDIKTARGIVLLNVPPNEVASDLRERPLTNAAKAIVRSGDSILMSAIRRAAPKYFGEYERTLPPAERSPRLTTGGGSAFTGPGRRMATVRVTDANNRAIAGLSASDFEVLEAGKIIDIEAVRPISSRVNLVLLLDVSGSVDNYVNFIRKAARSFVETVDPNDRVSIVLFDEDVRVLSDFTTDKARLSESLDTFDAGGSTAYYDALAYTLADTLRPLRGERTAIVVLTDGDDNRSFLAFDSLAGAIEESGALIYPLYVPTGLIAASESTQAIENIDPLRNRHLTLTSKASLEGPRLAELSGGVYYPISRLTQIQEAYSDIALQLRTAYEITYRSTMDVDRAGSRLRVRTKKPGHFVSVESIVQAGSR